MEQGGVSDVTGSRPVAAVERRVECGLEVRQLVQQRVGRACHRPRRAQPLQLARRQRQGLRLRATLLAAHACRALYSYTSEEHKRAVRPHEQHLQYSCHQISYIDTTNACNHERKWSRQDGAMETKVQIISDSNTTWLLRHRDIRNSIFRDSKGAKCPYRRCVRRARATAARAACR